MSLTSLPAITFPQPYATFVTLGLKTLDIRARSINHSGPLVICSDEHDHKIMGLLSRIESATYLPITDTVRQALCVANARARNTIGYPRGFALALAYARGCRAMTPEDEVRALCPFDDGLIAWEFSTVTQIRHFKVNSKLGIFRLPIPKEEQQEIANRLAIMLKAVDAQTENTLSAPPGNTVSRREFDKLSVSCFNSGGESRTEKQERWQENRFQPGPLGHVPGPPGSPPVDRQPTQGAGLFFEF